MFSLKDQHPEMLIRAATFDIFRIPDTSHR